MQKNRNVKGFRKNPDTRFDNEICWKCARAVRILGAQNNNELGITINKARDLVLNHYGRVCNCCGETEELFLEIDHINNDGAEHRKELGNVNICIWIVINDYPNTIQILCANCNKGKFRNCGICPHKKRIRLVSNE